MKHFFSLATLFMLLAFSAQTHAQDVLGCTAIYADNYNPDATINDGTCNYDLPQLLGDGYCIGELLNGGVLWQDFRGVEYQGGTIVHVSESQGLALICANQNSNTFAWGCSDQNVGGTTSGAYTGLSNTETIMTSGCLSVPAAAQEAYLSTLNGYADWFLPSPTEMDYAYICPDFPTKPSTGSTGYWTSQESSSCCAWVARYGDGSYGSYTKSSNYNVRMMRYVEIDQNCLEQGVCGDWQYDGEQLQPEAAGVSCSYELFSCANTGDPVWNSIILGVYPASTTEIQYGLTWDRDILLNVPDFYEYQGNMYDVVGFEVNGVSGVPEGLTIDIAAGDQVAYNNQACLGLSGDVLLEGSYTLEISGTLLLSILGSPFSIEGIVLTHQIEVTPNTDGIPGCIYDFAGNFNPIATYDDGSCVAGSQGPCPGDLDGDQLIGVGDILSLLSLFNSSCN